MAERHRSKDGVSETEELLDGAPDAPEEQGRSGGRIATKTGTRDEKKQLDETSSGATRPLAQDQDKSGNKESV
ncbi:hypothetical protein [Litorisediminicola beolgyonensis]|uniref:Uncharacterized protein n=1 Tax=Litorisediminicola beolgyonensis TaxID=1173614 RepID=A0ABW3ZJR4_9RHOB